MWGMKLTPVLIVEDIEKSLPFWVDRLGFQKTVEVPAGDRLGFVILANAGTELMLQSWKSVAKDSPPGMWPQRGFSAGLFIEVEDFADIRLRLEGWPVALPERVTFYGMREIGVHEPGGHVVIFAANEPK